MDEKYTCVNVYDLVPGMVLAENAVHLTGRVLLQSGTCLTEKHLRIFKTWGLTEANIKASIDLEGVNSKISIDPKDILMAEEIMQKRFSKMNLKSIPVAELYRICVKEYAENINVIDG